MSGTNYDDVVRIIGSYNRDDLVGIVHDYIPCYGWLVPDFVDDVRIRSISFGNVREKCDGL